MEYPVIILSKHKRYIASRRPSFTPVSPERGAGPQIGQSTALNSLCACVLRRAVAFRFRFGRDVPFASSTHLACRGTVAVSPLPVTACCFAPYSLLLTCVSLTVPTLSTLPRPAWGSLSTSSLDHLATLSWCARCEMEPVDDSSLTPRDHQPYRYLVTGRWRSLSIVLEGESTTRFCQTLEIGTAHGRRTYIHTYLRPYEHCTNLPV